MLSLLCRGRDLGLRIAVSQTAALVILCERMMLYLFNSSLRKGRAELEGADLTPGWKVGDGHGSCSVAVGLERR